MKQRILKTGIWLNLQLIHTKKPPAKILTVNQLANFGRVQLSPSFFMRDFLYSEMPPHPTPSRDSYTNRHNALPESPWAATGSLWTYKHKVGLPLNAKGAENRNQYRCASNERNYARHIWDYPDEQGNYGVMACVVVNSYLPHYEATKDWKTLANWIENNIPEYLEMCFYPKLCAFNISWRQKPKKSIKSHISSR